MDFEFLHSIIEWSKESENNWFLTIASIVLGLPSFFLLFYNRLKRLLFRQYYVDENFNRDSFRKVTGYIPIRCSHFEPEQIDAPSQLNGAGNEFFINEPQSDTTVIRHLLQRSFLGSKWRNKDFKKVLLIGGPGTGKSLSLYKIFKRLSNPLELLINKYPRVILYSMNRWKKEDDWTKDHNLISLMSEENKVNKRNCVFILDAFDEYCEAKKLTDFEAMQLIDTLFEKLNGFKAVVIATRPLQNNFSKNVIHLHLLPFNTEEIRQSIKKRYLRKFPFIPKFNKEYLELNKRLTENSNFLLDRICRRPLLLRYLEDIRNIPYHISKEKILEIVDIEEFKPSEVCLRNYPFWGEREFREALKKEVDIQTNSRIKERLVSVSNKLTEIAARAGRLENYTEIYHHILLRWHGREAKKNNLNSDEYRYFYFLFMDEVLTAVAGYMAANQTLAITQVAFRLEVSKVHISWKSNTGDDSFRRKFIDILIPEDDLGTLDPTKRSILKIADNQNLYFTHRSFYDYYLAKYILSQDGNEIAKLRILELQELSETWVFYKEMVNRQFTMVTFGIETDLDLETPKVITAKIEWLKRMDKLEMIEFVIDKDKFKVEKCEENTNLIILRLSITLWAIRKGSEALLSDVYKTNGIGYEGIIYVNFNFTSIDSETFKFRLLELFFSFASHTSITFWLNQLPEVEIQDLLATTTNYGMTPLSWVCVHNSSESVKAVLNAYSRDKNEWLESQDSQTWSALILACRYSSFETVIALLSAYKGDKNRWLEKQDKEGWTALSFACCYNSFETVNSLLNAHSGDKNSWLETQNIDGWNALTLACRNNSFKTVNALLSAYKGNKNHWLERQDNDGFSLLMIANFVNSLEMLIALLNAHSGDKNRWLEMKEKEGFTALMIACQNNSLEMVIVMLKAHSGDKNQWLETQNKEGFTALMYSCVHKSFETVNVLVNAHSGEKGKWLETQANQGSTVLMMACRYSSFETINILIMAHPGNKNLWLEIQEDDGWTALMYACVYNSFDTVRILLNAHSGNKNKWLEMQNKAGYNVLMHVCASMSFEAVNSVLSAYSGNKNNWLEMQEQEGWTALMIACCYNSLETVDSLISAYSGDKNLLLEMQKNNGKTALILACLHNSYETVIALLNSYSGSKTKLLEIQDRDGHTALVKALLYSPGKRHEKTDEEGKHYHSFHPKGTDPFEFDNLNSQKIVRLLLENGAQANSPFLGKSLKEVALANGHYLAAELF